MSRFRQGIVTGFVLATLLNLWFLLSAMEGYKLYGIVRPVDASAAGPDAFRIEVVLVAVSAIAWWLSRPKVE